MDLLAGVAAGSIVFHLFLFVEKTVVQHNQVQTVGSLGRYFHFYYKFGKNAAFIHQPSAMGARSYDLDQISTHLNILENPISIIFFPQKNLRSNQLNKIKLNGGKDQPKCPLSRDQRSKFRFLVSWRGLHRAPVVDQIRKDHNKVQRSHEKGQQK